MDRQLGHRLRLTTLVDRIQPKTGGHIAGPVRRQKVCEALAYKAALQLQSQQRCEGRIGESQSMLFSSEHSYSNWRVPNHGLRQSFLAARVAQQSISIGGQPCQAGEILQGGQVPWS
jgi:hypothetical protein